ncbi:MAG: metal ABC transporter permease [Patescibacteria group bacterium]|nr:metal ABC transporter permease [Patescibacteria group bacterium]
MLELFQYSFLNNAILVGALSGITCGIIGSFIVVKKISFVSGSIAHASFGGIGLAYFLGLSPVLGAVVFSLLSALGIGFINKKNKVQEDASIGAIWAIGMAIGLVFIYFTPGYAVDLFSYLFGNILLISTSDLWYILFLNIFIIISVIYFFKWLVASIFDEEFSTVINIPVFPLYLFLLSLIALSVVTLIKSVGVILVIALLTLPTSTAQLLNKNFKNIIIIAVPLAVLENIVGVILSYFLNIPTGPLIILIAGLVYLFVLIFRNKKATY